MKNLSSLVAAKIFLICVLFGLLTAMAMPKYLDLNKNNQQNICQANQILVETALAVAYADSLAKGIHHFPQKLTAAMFEDKKIPTCPVAGRTIEFDPTTGKALCPHHKPCHGRTFE